MERTEFVVADHCRCCHEPLTLMQDLTVILRLPEGEADTLCRRCYRDITSSAVAWNTFEGNLGPESMEGRLRRARDIARARIAANTLADIVFEN